VSLKLIITQRAELSLANIIDYYLSEYSSERAMKVLQSIEGSFIKISSTPFAYSVCFDLAEPSENIRQIIVHSTFKIIYRVTLDRIEVLEIFHGSRDNSNLIDLE
jgi:toxin ParE1/3/4